MSRNSNKRVAIWLFACCFMVFCLIVIGGLTRLTESGLSITEWKPFTGAIPPLNEEQWLNEFEKYKASPEFNKKNFDMTLSQFKNIFWVEFLHRLEGRLTGFVFLLPFIFFLARKEISKNLALKLSGIFLLGGLQGFLGWYMVKSGLIDDPRVSPYRLALHLVMAFLIFGLLFLAALSIWFRGQKKKIKVKADIKTRRISYGITVLVLLQVTAGAFVAGNDAGLIYNTFPLMDGQFIPDAAYAKDTLAKNIFEDVTTVQLNHRLLAYIVAFMILWQYLRAASNATLAGIYSRMKQLVAIMVVQVALGILTLVSMAPISLASLHQALALIFFSYSLFINYILYVNVPAKRKPNS